MHDYHELHIFDAETFIEDTLDDVVGSFFSCKKLALKERNLIIVYFNPFFNWFPINLIKNSFKLSTQHARTPAFSLLKKTRRSLFPTFHSKLRSEPVSTDTVYSDTPDVNDGST